jgi:glycyl-tRNA synthetase
MDTLVSLCKRRGFVFQSSEIYGGFGSCWDYGPMGTEMKRNIKEAWWRGMVRERDDIVGLDSAILQHPQVWVASGHLENFTDPLVDCKQCRQRFRADQLETAGKCPACGGELTEERQFNTMFKTFVGPLEDTSAVAYLRPETAQGIFINFKNVHNASRKKLPFGIAQQGKSFRNEITTGNFIFRTREFEQMEMEFFVKPGTDEEWYAYWVQARLNWYKDLGVKPDNLRLYEHPKAKLSHYSKGTTDVEYLYPFGWGELEGIASRTDFDLKAHSTGSGEKLEYFDDETNENYIPYVIEPAAGVDRMLLVFLLDAYDEETVNGETRVVLRLHKRIAPVKVAVLPLSKKEPLASTARDLRNQLSKRWNVDYDDRQAIGRRYRRQDEIGTPLCVTVDFQTLEDQAVTIRDRDTMEQDRVPIANLEDVLYQKLGF